MPFLRTTKTFKNSTRPCEICDDLFRTRVIGVFDDDGEWLEDYGVCEKKECKDRLYALTISGDQDLHS